MHEDVAVLVVSEAGGGVDAGEFLGSRVSCGEDGFDVLIRLTLPTIFRQFFTLATTAESAKP